MSDSTSRAPSVADNAPVPIQNENSERHDPLAESIQHGLVVDPTVIAQSPIAGPGEFYPTGTVATLARVLIGQKLDHYQLHELVGGGGMGAVFRASDTRLDRIVAVKVIPSLGRDLETLRRFRIEAQSAAKLDHPHIARVYYVGETEAWSYIVFEYVEGTNLRDLIVRQGPLSIDDAVCFTCQAAEALQHATDRSVVHRDIKPSNLLVTPEGIIKVVDMGLARTTALDRTTNDLTASGVTLGTFDYISPEQARDPRAADVRSDLYSLGCTLYFMLTGRPPYPEGTAMQKLLMHGSVQADDARDFRDDVSADLSAIIRKLMAKKPEDRYQRPIDLIADLQCLANLENLTKSQQSVGLIVAPVSSDRSLFELATPWVMGALAILGSTWYLHSQYEASASFDIPLEFEIKIPNEEPGERVSQLDGRLAPFFVRPSEIDKTIEFNLLDPSASTTSSTEINGLSLPEIDGPTTADNEIAKLPSMGAFSLPGTALAGNSSNIPSQKSTQLIADATEVKARILWVRPFESTDAVAEQDSEHRIFIGNFSDALALANASPEIEEIWLDDDVWIVDKALALKRASLVIRSAPDRKARIEIRIPRNASSGLDGSYLNDRITGINIAANQITLNDLDLFVVPPDSGSGSLSLIGLAPGGLARVMQSTITLSANGASWRSNCFGASPLISPTNPASARTHSEPLRIALEDVVVRGEGDLFALETAIRSELRWQNGLLAINGRMFELGGAKESSRTPPTIRVDLEQVTMAARQGFARIRLTKDAAFPLCLSRDSKNCAYSSERSYPLIALENVDFGDRQAIDDQLPTWLDLRGRDNAYDQQIDTLVRCTSAKGAISKIAFESASQAFFTERAPETNIRWINPRPVPKPFEQQTAGDYLQREGDFQPGFRPELLPNH